MKKIRLTPEEKEIESAMLRGEYRPVSEEKFQAIAAALARRKKDAVLNIRVNRQDLDGLKMKAKSLGVPYQTLISELLHQFAA